MEFSSQHRRRLIPEVRLRNSLLFYNGSLALIEAASFFDEERGEKDTAESRFPAPKKQKNPLKIN